MSTRVLEGVRARVAWELEQYRELWLARAVAFVASYAVWTGVLLYALLEWLGAPAGARLALVQDIYPVAVLRVLSDPLNPFSLTVVGLAVLTIVVGEGMIALAYRLRMRWA